MCVRLSSRKLIGMSLGIELEHPLVTSNDDIETRGIVLPQRVPLGRLRCSQTLRRATERERERKREKERRGSGDVCGTDLHLAAFVII